MTELNKTLFLLDYGHQPRLPIKSDKNCIDDSVTEEKQSVGSEENVLMLIGQYK